MKRRLALLLILIVLVSAAACSTAASNKEAASPSAPLASPAAAASSPPEAEPNADNQVKASHISFNLPAGWTQQGGEESFSFQKDGAPVGGLDGLGFSETIDGLLPNGATVDSQEELTGMPVKTVMAKLSLEAQGDGGKRKEYHFFYFLTEQKVVYDLHFDSDQAKESEARAVAQTAVVK
jgi:hypothetical protein